MKNSTSGRTKVFISYSHQDHYYLRELQEQLGALQKRGLLDVWVDTRLEAGDLWREEIRQALASAKVAILLVSPAFLNSKFITEEELPYLLQAAKRDQVRILPVILKPCLYDETELKDYQSVNSPQRPLSGMNKNQRAQVWVSVSKIAKVALEGLSQGKAVTEPLNAGGPGPYMIGSLPRFYVQRASLHSIIKSQLISANSDASKSPTLSLLGAGGFGKTTLVRAICSDPEVIDHFDDGILWVTLGENITNILEKVNGIISSLTSLHSNLDSIEIAAKRLRELLSQRKCLLVLDDVWNIADIEPFFGDDTCTRIITTRDAAIAAQADSSPILVNEMQTEEAVQVLLNHIPTKYQRDEALALYLPEMAMKLGKWPLLVELFGMTIRQEIQQGNSLQKAIEYINEGLQEQGFTAFDSGNPERRNQALAASMNVSLRVYNPSDKKRLYELSIFPQNVAIPEHVVLRLWSGTSKMSKFEGRKLLRRFSGHFFQMSAQEPSEELHLFFHDAMREYLTKQMDIQEWRQAHESFLKDYNPIYRGKWWEIHDDGYLYHNLIYHLINADSEQELLDVLVGSPNWQNEKFALFGSNQSFINDLEQAIQVFEQKDTKTSLVHLVELYAALQVVFTRIELYTDDDLRTLASFGKNERALNYARLRSDTGSVFNGLVAVYETLVATFPVHTAPQFLIPIRKELDGVLKNVRPSEKGLIALAKIYLTEKEYKRVEKIIEHIGSGIDAIELCLELATIVTQFDKVWGSTLFDISEHMINNLEYDPDRGDLEWRDHIWMLMETLVSIGDVERVQHIFYKSQEYMDEYDNRHSKQLVEIGEEIEEVIGSEFTHLPKSDGNGLLFRFLLTYQQYSLLDEAISRRDGFYPDRKMMETLLLVGETLLSKNKELAMKVLDKVNKGLLSQYGIIWDRIDLLIRLYMPLAQIDQSRADKLVGEILPVIRSFGDSKERVDLLASLAGVCAKFNTISTKQVIDEMYGITDEYMSRGRKRDLVHALFELAIELTKGRSSYSSEVVDKTVEAILSLKNKNNKVSKLKALTALLAREKYSNAPEMFKLVERISYETLDNDGWLMVRVGLAIIFLRAAYPKSDSFLETLMEEIASFKRDYDDGYDEQRVYQEASQIFCRGLLAINRLEDVERYSSLITDEYIKADTIKLLEEKRRETIPDGLSKQTSATPPKHLNPVASPSSPISSSEIEKKDALIQQALELSSGSGGYRQKVADKAQKRSALARKLINLGELDIAEKVINDINTWYSYARDDRNSAGTSSEALYIRNEAIAFLVKAHLYLGNYFKGRNYAYTSGVDQKKLQHLSSDVALDLVSTGNFKQALRVFGPQNINRYIEFLSAWSPESISTVGSDVNTFRLILVTKVLNITRWTSPNCASIYEYFYS